MSTIKPECISRDCPYYLPGLPRLNIAAECAKYNTCDRFRICTQCCEGCDRSEQIRFTIPRRRIEVIDFSSFIYEEI